MAAPGGRRPHFAVHPRVADVFVHLHQRRVADLVGELLEDGRRLVRRDERQRQRFPAVAVHVSVMLLIVRRQTDTALTGNKK